MSMTDEEWARMTGQTSKKKPAPVAKPAAKAPEKKKKKKKKPSSTEGLGKEQTTLREKIRARHDRLSNAGLAQANKK